MNREDKKRMTKVMRVIREIAETAPSGLLKSLSLYEHGYLTYDETKEAFIKEMYSQYFFKKHFYE